MDREHPELGVGSNEPQHRSRRATPIGAFALLTCKSAIRIFAAYSSHLQRKDLAASSFCRFFSIRTIARWQIFRRNSRSSTPYSPNSASLFWNTWATTSASSKSSNSDAWPRRATSSKPKHRSNQAPIAGGRAFHEVAPLVKTQPKFPGRWRAGRVLVPFGAACRSARCNLACLLIEFDYVGVRWAP